MEDEEISAEEQKEEDIYTDEGTDPLLEDDEISPEEAAFMEGYNNA